MNRKLTPVALLIALALAGTAGLANATPSNASSDPWFAPVQQLMMCIGGNPFACMAPATGGSVQTFGHGGPCIRNK